MLGGICPVCLCMCVRFWDMPSSPSRYAGSWFVLGFVSLLCWSVLLYEVLGLPCALFFCVFVFWCLVMSSPVGARSRIGHRDGCVFGSMSYLIFPDTISSGVVVVCLSGILSYF